MSHPVLYAVIRERTSAWDWSRPMEEQKLWREHADYMDGLVSEGFLELGGPLEDDKLVLHIVHAESPDAVRARFEADPWHDDLLVTASIDAWTIRLDARGRAEPDD